MRDRDVSWPKTELGRMFKRAAKQPGIIVACWYFASWELRQDPTWNFCPETSCAMEMRNHLIPRPAVVQPQLDRRRHLEPDRRKRVCQLRSGEPGRCHAD
ncbi:hypothetical protein MDA_GLEAN10023882 [Myotis davidii]|uniref:Uncharacterized protein n=1 Tax=Myotis davidii TaxID=225400 RepID=L5LMK4_MYODS|nr:hypothetical protein MDA_GLEAN10023882 [Myotis davidii]